MLNDRIQHEYQPEAIQNEFATARHTVGLAYPTRYALFRYYTEASALQLAEAENRPFFFDGVRDEYREVTLAHMVAARQPYEVDPSEADAVAHSSFKRWDKYGSGRSERYRLALAAAVLPAVTMEGYVESAFAIGAFDRRESIAWYDDVFGSAASVVDRLHGGDCEDISLRDDIDDMSCRHYGVCPHNELRSTLLRPLRQLGHGVIDMVNPEKSTELTEIKLKAAILHGFTTLRDEEKHVEQFYHHRSRISSGT